MGICNQGERRVLVLNLCEESAGEDRSLRCSKRGAAPPFPIQPFASRLPDSYSTVTLSKSGEDVLLLQLAHRVRLISDGQETSKDTRIFRSFYVKEGSLRQHRKSLTTHLDTFNTHSSLWSNICVVRTVHNTHGNWKYT